ncbi:hypothetical protein [Streptomyces sp. NPDC058295]|uniref:hypothetical protein n=1 Tax=Streptomyces sp. NPDC058295 TaxID=3346431 RepID=UPI0036EE7946
MPSMPPPALEDSRPPLPARPQPHERDGRQPQQPGSRPHPQHTARHATLARPIGAAAMIPTVITLPRTTEDEIGPRRPGAIYQNTAGAWEVLAVVRDPERARQLLRRGSARWAVIVRDVLRHDSEPVAIGSVWTTSDHLVREGRTEPTYAPAA